jgi:hypothetical protein
VSIPCNSEGGWLHSSATCLVHAYELTPGGVATRFGLFEAPEFAVSYLLLFVLFFAVGWWEKK